MGDATRNIISSSGPKQNRKYSIIIPAAGLGTRMKKYGPKSLIKINAFDTILDRQLRIIDKTFRWYEVILVTGFQHDKVQRQVPSKVKIVYNKDYEETNVVHSIGIGLKHCTTNNIIIIYGDLIFNKASINVPLDCHSTAVIAGTMKSEEVGCTINQDNIEQMFYGIPNKWAQILFLCGKELEMMKQFTSNQKNSTCYGFEAINDIITNMGVIKSYEPPNAKIMDIDTSSDLKKAIKII